MIISVKVKTNQRKSDFIEVIKDKEFIAFIKESPINNKANYELINLVSKHFNIPHNYILIKRGTKSKEKIVLIKNER